MDTVVPELAVQEYDASGLHQQREDVLAVYAEVYADELDDPFYSLPRYWAVSYTHLTLPTTPYV